MASPKSISSTPSLGNQSSPQVFQQQKEQATASRIFAEQERRNQTIRLQEEEARIAEQDRAYSEVSNAVNTINDIGDKLEKAASRYNELVDRYNAASTTEEKNQLRQDIERARIEYNDLTGQYAAYTNTYNEALEFAKATGAISSGESITYQRETISSPFEGTEAELKARQKQQQDIYTRQRAQERVNELIDEVNTKSASLNKSKSEYNALIDEFNSAKSSSEQKRLLELIDSKASEYNLLSADFESATNRYNMVISGAKAAGIVDSSATELSYSRETLSPMYDSMMHEIESREKSQKSINALVEEVNTKSASLSKAGSEYNSLVNEFNSATNVADQERLKGLIENKASEYNLLSGELESLSSQYNAAISTAKSKGYIGDSAELSYSRQTLSPMYEAVNQNTQPETNVFVDEVKQPEKKADVMTVTLVNDNVRDFFDNAGTVVSDFLKNRFAEGVLSVALAGKATKQGIEGASEALTEFAENGIPNNPLTTEYTLPNGMKWQLQTTAAQDREREAQRQEESWDNRIEFFNASANYYSGLSDDFKETVPAFSDIAKGASEFMKFNKGEAEVDRVFAEEGLLKIDDSGISVNRPSVYLAGAAALTAGAGAGLAAVGAGGAAVASIPEGAAGLATVSRGSGGTATATLNSNQAVQAISGVASETGKQNAALLFNPSSSEIGSGTKLINQPEIEESYGVVDRQEISTIRGSVFTPELIVSNTAINAPELGKSNKIINSEEISLNRIAVNSGVGVDFGNQTIEGYPVRIDKLAQLERLGLNSNYLESNGYEYSNGNNLRDGNDTITRGIVGIGTLNRTGLNNQNVYNNRYEDETKNRNRYEYVYRNAPGYKFENIRDIRLPNIDIDLTTKGEKKKRGKKKSGKAVLKQHYLPSSKDFIGDISITTNRKKKSTDLFSLKGGKKKGLI